MGKNRYFYYDQPSCSFVEVKESRRRLYGRVTLMVIVAIFLASAMTLGLDQFVSTPQELALMDENGALQQQLADVGQRINDVSGRLQKLSATDQNLYRTLLEAEPISEDVRQVGVGGTDPFPEFSGYSSSTRTLLESTSGQIEQLERQIGLQGDSYRELTVLAAEHEVALEEMPAILPTDGPIVSGYGLRFHPILKVRRMHYGLDVHVPRGTPVETSGDGVILQVGTGSGFGNFVKVKHPTAGYITIYAHLSKVPKNIRKGVRVKRGDLIAYSGNTGLTSAPHLHYEVHDLSGRALNPIYFLAPSMTPSAYHKLLEETKRTTASLD
jgi:murein DD-endopeptidase MepM/ murein hydrolase activator NlpD